MFLLFLTSVESVYTRIHDEIGQIWIKSSWRVIGADYNNSGGYFEKVKVLTNVPRWCMNVTRLEKKFEQKLLEISCHDEPCIVAR